MSQDNLTTFGIPLARLNKDSAKVGEFYVRVVAPKVKKFQYNSKWSGVQQQGQRFTCHLVGYDDACYLRGEVGGSSGAVDIASNKFLDGTAWKLSKTCLDARAKAAYISGPLKMVINLEKTICTAILEGAKEEEHLKKTISPPCRVADAAVLKSQMTFDLLAIAREVTPPRSVIVQGVQKSVAIASLVDGSQTQDGKAAELEVSIWDHDLLQAVVPNVPLVFVGLASKFNNGLTVSTSRDAEIVTCGDSAKARSLIASKEEIVNTQQEDRQLMTNSFVPTPSINVTGDVTLSCAAVLEAAADAPSAMPTNFVVQMNWARIEEPAAGAKVLTNDGDRIFFTTSIRDFSGCTTTGITEVVALALSGIQSKQEFVAQHQQGEVKFPLFASVRGVRRVKAKPSTGANQPNDSTDASAGEHVEFLLADGCAMSFRTSLPPNESSKALLELLTHCPPNHEGMLPASLSLISACPFYNLAIQYPENTRRNAQKVIALVQAQGKSQLLETTGGHQVHTDNIFDLPDFLDGSEPVKYNLMAYCSKNDVMDFKLDPPRGQSNRVALVIITRVLDKEFVVEAVEHVEPDDVRRAVKVMKKLMKLAAQVNPRGDESLKRQIEFASSPPTAVKKCRRLCLQPTDQSI